MYPNFMDEARSNSENKKMISPCETDSSISAKKITEKMDIENKPSRCVQDR